MAEEDFERCKHGEYRGFCHICKNERKKGRIDFLLMAYEHHGIK